MNIAAAQIEIGTGSRSAMVADVSGATRAVRAGGIAALLLATGYIVNMPPFAMVGVPPVGTVERLDYHVTGTATWWGSSCCPCSPTCCSSRSRRRCTPPFGASTSRRRSSRSRSC